MQLSTTQNQNAKMAKGHASNRLISAILGRLEMRETHKAHEVNNPELSSFKGGHKGTFSKREERVHDTGSGPFALFQSLTKHLLGEEATMKNPLPAASHPHVDQGSDQGKMPLSIPVRLAGDESTPCRGRRARHWVLHGRSQQQRPQQ